MPNKIIGLSLSGGGYRAAAFHLGTLNKLHELGILRQVANMSTVSGGSIIGASYALHKGAYEDFKESFYQKLLRKNVIRAVLQSRGFIFFCLTVISLATLSILIWNYTSWLLGLFSLIASIYLFSRYQFRLFPVSRIIEDVYDRYFFDKATLKDLSQEFKIVINSTNLQTGRPFSFSRGKMSDSAYSYPEHGMPIEFKHEDFPVAKAVIASSCVPHVFTPIAIERKYYANPSNFEKIKPMLIDGGIYDNQGIHKLSHRNSSYLSDIIITSDAGNKLPFQKHYNNNFVLLARTVELFMQRIKFFQMAENVFNNSANKEIAYFSLAWNPDECLIRFVKNLKEGRISKEIILLHGIPEQLFNDLKNEESALLDWLKAKIKYADIEKLFLSKERLSRVRSIGTNLMPFGKNRLDDIIMHAEVLTELQLRLYCPSLF